MAKIGSLGKTIVFTTSDKKILTFSDFKQNVSGRWATHERIRKKPLSEFLGPGLRTVTFDITVNAMHGVKPHAVLKSINEMIEKGKAEKLVIGGHKVGGYQWKITSASEQWDTVLNKGELLQATLSLSLEEYV